MSRKFFRPIKKIVIKVGSSVMATHTKSRRVPYLKSLVHQISAANAQGLDVVLVSSGAIVLGMVELGLKVRPSDVASLQALAAIGQAVLMKNYSDLFKKAKTKCAQVLLTWDDFDSRHRYNNARHTLAALLERRVIPVVNENDTISTEEIKFGDNDKLSAFVASLIGADLLIILSDVEGFYDLQSGKKEIFREVKEITKEIEGLAGGTEKKHISTGGMSAKLQAIKIATHANIPCIIANWQTKDVLSKILQGDRIGTFFMEKEEKLLARRHWISFGAKPKGRLVVDEGAKNALLNGGRSLLLPGVLKWEGHFRPDEVVVICDQQGEEIARGIINYAAADLERLKGANDKRGQKEAIHRDDLVLCKR
ncbi:MAG: glutamate 5-kinase [Candidatus Omnitrophica bacterium]|nr:glutamate 5-kinase [Candidatus Omnitrophota bacterium]